uniref:Uncharacterized protein n=1 Tax=Meloidogyne enterolobii TaxID=390850 RepID=A0A6V7WR52_MELEN|nr:unnamed protein product [Meloidogyne enterolobii]
MKKMSSEFKNTFNEEVLIKNPNSTNDQHNVKCKNLLVTVTTKRGQLILTNLFASVLAPIIQQQRLIKYRCCDKHHVCVRALKKECPTTTNELHYVYLNTSNYHSDKLLYDVPWTLDLKPSIKHPFPCVGCKDWCKNKKGYTCNYTCE